MTTCCEINVSKKPACRCLHLLQIAIAGKRWASQGLRYAAHIAPEASKIKALAAYRAPIGHVDRLRDRRAAPFGNLYLQICADRCARASPAGGALQDDPSGAKSKTPGNEPSVPRRATYERQPTFTYVNSRETLGGT
jgi:hypothetical protein